MRPTGLLMGFVVGGGGGVDDGLGERVDLVVVAGVWEGGEFFDEVLDPLWGMDAVVVCVAVVGGSGEVDVAGFDLGCDGVGAVDLVAVGSDEDDAGDVVLEGAG